MADKELRVHLKADDDISKAAKSAKSELDRIPDKVETKLEVDSSGFDKLGDLPGLLGEVGGMLSGGGGVAAGMGLAAAAANDLAQGFADAALEARVTADLTGSTIEAASRLQAVWKQSGADVNDLNDVLLQMNGVLQTSPEMARQIGVNLQDGADVGARFVEVVGKIQNSTLGASDKAQLMSQMFGEEGVRQVAKLTASIDGPLSQAIEDVSDAQIISEDEERRAQKLTQATKDLRSAWEDFKMTAGSILLEPVANSMTKTTAAAEGLKKVTGDGKFWDNSGMDDYRASLGEMTVQLDTSVDNLKNYREQLSMAPASAGTIRNLASAFSEIAAVTEDSGDAADDANRATASYKRTLQETAEAARELMGVEGEAADQRRALADSEFAFRDAQRDFAQSIIDTTKALQDSGPATAEGAAALDDFAVSAGGAADAAVRLEIDQKTAAGATVTAAESQATWNQSMITSARQASGPMRAAIENYIATVNGIPPEKVSEILANTDYASVAEAQAALDKAAADQTAMIIAEAETAAAAAELDAIAARKRTAVIQATVAYRENVNLGGSNAPVPRSVTPAAAGMSTYAATPAPTGLPPIVVNVPVPVQVAPSITINAGVVGNRFDTARTVSRALRRHQRLNGRRE